VPHSAPPVARALSSLRVAKGWSQRELAAAAGLAPNLLSDYERGRKPLSAERAHRLVGALGLNLSALDRALLFVTTLESPDRDRPHARRADEPGANGGLAARPARSRGWIEVARPPAAERAEALHVWSRLACHPVKERRLLVERDPGARSWALAELVAGLSLKEVVDSPPRARELAALAVRIAELSPGEERWRASLQSYAWAHVANAHRVGNDMRAAEVALGRAKALQARGDAATGPLNEHMAGRFESSLLRDLGRTREALDVLDRMLAVAQGRDVPPLLMMKGGCLNLLGRPCEAARALGAALRVSDAGTDRRLISCLQQELVRTLVRAGHVRKAQPWLRRAREGFLRSGGEIDLLRLDMVEAEMDLGLGRRAEALDGFARARDAFAVRSMDLDAAECSLELAAELARGGRPAEAKREARRAAEVYEGLGVVGQARRALSILRDGAVRSA